MVVLSTNFGPRRAGPAPKPDPPLFWFSLGLEVLSVSTRMNRRGTPAPVPEPVSAGTSAERSIRRDRASVTRAGDLQVAGFNEFADEERVGVAVIDIRHGVNQ